jgi:hypothetical protein
MLGARIIVARLRESLGEDASYCFYGTDGVETGDLWESLGLCLEQAGIASAAEISASAGEMFDVYGEWISGATPQGALLAC